MGTARASTFVSDLAELVSETVPLERQGAGGAVALHSHLNRPGGRLLKMDLNEGPSPIRPQDSLLGLCQDLGLLNLLQKGQVPHSLLIGRLELLLNH